MLQDVVVYLVYLVNLCDLGKDVVIVDRWKIGICGILAALLLAIDLYGQSSQISEDGIIQ